MSHSQPPRAPTPLLRGYRDLAAGRSALDGRLRTCDPVVAAGIIDALLAKASMGHGRGDHSNVIVASWLLHVDGDRRRALCQAADEADLPLAAAILDAPVATRGVRRHGRLPEVSIPAATAVRFPMPQGRVYAYMYRWTPEEHPYRFAELHDSARRPWSRESHYIDMLCKHPDARLVSRVLAAPWVRVREVLQIAARRPTTSAIAYAVAKNDRWLSHPRVRAALANNPFSPPTLVLSLLLASERNAWVRLSDPAALHESVAHAACLLRTRRADG